MLVSATRHTLAQPDCDIPDGMPKLTDTNSLHNGRYVKWQIAKVPYENSSKLLAHSSMGRSNAQKLAHSLRSRP